MGATLTKGEQTLVGDGKAEVVLHSRRAFQDTMQAEAISTVQELSGRKVVAFMSNNHIDPDLAVEVFVLEPAGSDLLGISLSTGMVPDYRRGFGLSTGIVPNFTAVSTGGVRWPLRLGGLPLHAVGPASVAERRRKGAVIGLHSSTTRLIPTPRAGTLLPSAGHRGAAALGRAATRRGARGLPCAAARTAAASIASSTRANAVPWWIMPSTSSLARSNVSGAVPIMARVLSGPVAVQIAQRQSR